MEPSQKLKELTARASDFPFDNKISLKRFVRTTKEMERMALVYATENETENSFVLYMRMITLILEKLPKHHEYKQADSETKSLLTKKCKTALTTAEKLKSILRTQYQKDYEEYLVNQKKIKEEEEKQKNLQKEKENEIVKTNAVPSNINQNQPQDFAQNGHLPSATAPPLSSYPEIPSISTNEREQPFAQPPTNFSPSFDPRPPPSSPPPTYNDATNKDRTKTVNNAPAPFFYNIDNSGYSSFNNASVNQNINTNNIMPDRSSKPNHLITPEIKRDTKPDLFYTRQDSMPSVDGSRRVVIPSDLTSTFLRLASANTRQNLETCGILTGKLSHSVLRVTHLVIPKQSATPDSCTTESEEELFDVQDKYDLITLGWIHTHPSQTSFLSSVDLHTQCSYQQLIPEAIAIVCAPKYNTTGIYRLTPNYGLKFIASCNKTGFHPHPKEPPLFEDSPLVSVENGLATTVVDLR